MNYARYVQISMFGLRKRTVCIVVNLQQKSEIKLKKTNSALARFVDNYNKNYYTCSKKQI